MYTKLNMKSLTLVLLMMGMLVACQSNLENEIKLNSHELFSDNNAIAKIHIENNTSEYIKVDYQGTQKYNITYQVWLDGQVVSVENKIIDLKLSDYKGFSFEVYESELNIEVLMGLYTESGENGLTFPIENIKDYNVDQVIESKHIDDYMTKGGEEIFLWGIHQIREGPGINEMVENEYDVAEKSNWSIIFTLVPIKEI